MSDDTDDFSDLIAPDSEGAPRVIGLLTRAPAVNSVELELIERSYQEPALQTPVVFVEVEDGPETESTPSEMTAEDEMRSAMSAHYERHIAAARAAGPQGGWPEYRDICKLANMTPFKQRR
jgi:hypothetical protein